MCCVVPQCLLVVVVVGRFTSLLAFVGCASGRVVKAAARAPYTQFVPTAMETKGIACTIPGLPSCGSLDSAECCKGPPAGVDLIMQLAAPFHAWLCT